MKTLLAVPVHNEARYVMAVLGEARRHISEILMVDDGSTDETPHLLAETDGIRVIRHGCNLGYGRSLTDAFHYAACHRYDWIITMDCDGQHEPGHIPTFLAEAARNDCDIISGSRYLVPDPAAAPPPDRRSINMEMIGLLNRTLGLGLTDAFCGFKAYRVEALRRLHISESGYAMPLQLWVQAVAAGLRIREIPIRLIYNDPGRAFGGKLDDPEFRRTQYLQVLREALEAGGFAEAEYVQAVRECSCR